VWLVLVSDNEVCKSQVPALVNLLPKRWLQQAMGPEIKMGQVQNKAEMTDVSDLVVSVSLHLTPQQFPGSQKQQLQAQSRNQAVG